MHACSTIALVLALSGNHAAQAQEVTQDSGIQSILERSGDNRAEIETVLEKTPEDQQSGMRWLLERMPERDLRSLDAGFLLENTAEAYAAWRSAPWHDQVQRVGRLRVCITHEAQPQRTHAAALAVQRTAATLSNWFPSSSSPP